MHEMNVYRDQKEITNTMTTRKQFNLTEWNGSLKKRNHNKKMGKKERMKKKQMFCSGQSLERSSRAVQVLCTQRQLSILDRFGPAYVLAVNTLTSTIYNTADPLNQQLQLVT